MGVISKRDFKRNRDLMHAVLIKVGRLLETYRRQHGLTQIDPRRVVEALSQAVLEWDGHEALHPDQFLSHAVLRRLGYTANGDFTAITPRII